MSPPKNWRYRCPNGHTSWSPRVNRDTTAKSDYYCRVCAKNNHDPHFDHLQDLKQETTA